MNTEYKELISKTFCENSIRSVMMIDDDFIPYPECIKRLSNGDKLEDRFLEGSKKAAELTKFFQNKKFVCDVDNGTVHLDEERVRKCDLLVLDYQLEQNNPKPSLKILEKLRDSKHNNLVVIYTSENLDQAWLETAASLRGSINIKSLRLKEGDYDAWLDNTDGGAELPKSWVSNINPSDVEEYILSNKFSNRTRGMLAKELRHNTSAFMTPIGEELVSDYDKLKTGGGKKGLYGSNRQNKWLSIGNVFISFYQKSSSETEPQEIWDSLNESLHQWNPNYYRLITSEIQNHIEDGNLAMKGYLEHDYQGQAAWLWKLKTAETEEARRAVFLQLCDGISEGLWDGLLGNQELLSFSNDAVNSCVAIITEKPVQTASRSDDAANLNKYHHKVIKECAVATTDKPLSNNPDPALDIVHALNQSISSKPFSSHHVTIGTLLCSTSDDTQWFLCVSPACDTVPLQPTRFAPDRLLKFLHLSKTKLNMALKNATHGRYIFVVDSKNERIALQVLNEITSQPTIEYGIIKNHDNNVIDSNLNITVQLSGFKETVEWKPVYQLRDSYAARFQALASHHVGRVGVDFIPFDNSEPKVAGVTGKIIVSGHVEEAGDVSIDGDIEIQGDQIMGGELIVEGNVSMGSRQEDLTNIVVKGVCGVSGKYKEGDGYTVKTEFDVSSLSKQD